MANKRRKIGGIIALDGENEFKSAVTSCNKSLSALRSELQLVEAQTSGSANSLDSLGKKHEVLSKLLAEQSQKEEELKKGLEHARESYKKVGDQLGEYRTKLSQAQETLRQLESSQESSQEAIKQQREEVEKLSATVENGERTYQTAADRIQEWERQLNVAEAQTISTTRALNETATYMREAEQAADHCATSIDEFGREVQQAEEVTVSFGTMVKNNLVNTAVDAFKDLASEGVSAVLEMEAAQRQFQASTGATSSEMQQYKSVMDDLYSSNYGDDINDLAQSMALVKQYTGEIDPTNLEETTKNGIAMRDVFDMDLSETIRGVDALMSNMGVTSQEAFDLMATGAQNGLDKSGELADNIAEYSQLWEQSGFSAQEMFAIMDNGLDSGAYNLDKVNDFVKEFGNSLADGRIEESLGAFSSETQELFGKWKSGKATTKDVFRSVINDLANAENKQEALTLASDTWSALGEDNALKVIASLNKANHAYDDVAGTMESINAIKYDTLEGRLESLGRKFQTDVAEPIAEKALPLMEEGLDAVADNLDVLVPALEGVAVGFAVFKTAEVAVKLYTAAQTACTAATEGTTVATRVLNAVCNANPFVLVATTVAAAGTALFAYAQNAGEASKEVELLTSSNQRVCDSANEVTEKTKELVGSYADSSAELEAQGEYAQILAQKIESLAGKTKRSGEETSVMRGYIAELNQLMPDLNLSYDEQAKKLNLTNKEIESYIDNAQEQLEMQAAEEYASELIKKRTELKIQEIKLDKESEPLKEKQQELLEKEAENTNVLTDSIVALFNGKSDEYQSYKDTTEAIEGNNEASEANKKAQDELAAEIEATSEWLDQYGLKWDETTGKVIKDTEAKANNVAADAAKQESSAITIETLGQELEAYDALSQEQQNLATNVTNSVLTMQESVQGSLESQMNMFEEFNAGTEISKETLLENMNGQIEGVKNWEQNLTELARKGIDEGLLQKLAEMGPQGTTYVEAFNSMTTTELGRANELWGQSIDIKNMTNEWGTQLTQSVGELAAGGSEAWSQLAQSLNIQASSSGEYVVQGLVTGMQNAQKQATESGRDLGVKTIDSINKGAGVASPSKKTMQSGVYTVQGLAKGIDKTAYQAKKSGKSLGDSVVSVIKSALNRGRSGVREAAKGVGNNAMWGLQSGISVSTARTIGESMSNGLAEGIKNGQSRVITAVTELCAAAVTEANSRLEINSPSKVFKRIGRSMPEGMEIGFQEGIGRVNSMVRDSISIPQMGIGKSSRQAGTADKLTIELPIYVGQNYTKTEIVDIVLDGITKRQTGRFRTKGMRLS